MINSIFTTWIGFLGEGFIQMILALFLAGVLIFIFIDAFD